MADMGGTAAVTMLPAKAPIATPSMMGAQQTGLGYSFRYGKVTGDDAPSNFGLGMSYGHSSGTYGFTLGYLSPSQDGVDGNIMLGGTELLGPYVVQGPSVYPVIPGLDRSLDTGYRVEDML